jgi:hypothetical protein
VTRFVVLLAVLSMAFVVAASAFATPDGDPAAQAA